jgi:hypothetical protein
MREKFLTNNNCTLTITDENIKCEHQLHHIYNVDCDPDYFVDGISCTASEHGFTVLDRLVGYNPQLIHASRMCNLRSETAIIQLENYHLLLTPKTGLLSFEESRRISQDLLNASYECKVQNLRISQYCMISTFPRDDFLGFLDALEKTRNNGILENIILDVSKFFFEDFVSICKEKPYRMIDHDLDKTRLNQLFQAIRNFNCDELKNEIKKGRNLNQLNGDGIAAIHLAIIKNEINVVKKLLEKGADVNIKGINNKTPILVAATLGNLEIIELLVTKGADFNSVSSHGENALMFAANFGHLEAVKYFVNNGLTPDKRNIYGKTAIDFAKENKHSYISDFLCTQFRI